MATQRLFTRSKAASHIQEEATTSTQTVPAAEVILGDRNKLLRHLKSTRTIKNGIFSLDGVVVIKVGGSYGSSAV